jgi:secondary thiamine-phosphate synthase enzyme
MTTEILSSRHYQQMINLPSPGHGLYPQENADGDVLADLESFMARLVPENYPYRHCSEGPDDMPAHIRTALTHSSETIPIGDGRLTLGTWQGLYLWEHRRGRSTRQLVIHIMGC